ncbi:glycoside hydrolase family 3 protein [Aaosphaeria arxii CBS 175.79]|uniref:beta-glucosidase n=1 Tax=Aaosphaeria arxii CBS 175.79 TaxID=1450172 RepID=A0A6A5X987_9PLEO|nr:glycoside hydrolase family 3 protein [Aaosphaeria arxii CBS 175.79]KAF2009538.1 glycoside hydrolase family 3 protein [Aaosphaeria arxii CBS 175.79]
MALANRGSADSFGDLVKQLTLEEKISMLAGKNVWETFDVERLGIPSLKVTDGPNGARGGEFFDGTTAACFPACVSLAATFNRDLARKVGKALGQEAITKGAYVLLGPTVCCHRSPLGGRNFEAFSEDPLLSGALAIEYVKGLQEERVAATVKHFLANEQDTRRFSVNETVSERALREIYLKPFEMVAKQADPWCFMSSYPKVNGSHIDASSKFLNDILRGEWGYDGLVMSDWGAASTPEGIKYGLDLEMPGPSRQRTTEKVQGALQAGQISEEDIDKRVLNILNLLKKTGKFDDRKNPVKEQAIDRPEHRALIRKAGSEGIVLLKNENNILPIDVKKTKKIALLGPLANYSAAHGGGSASLSCHYKVSPYDAFKERLGKDVEITHGKGAHIFRVYPDLEEGCTNAKSNPGFLAEFFMTPEANEEPFRVEEYPRGSFTTLMNTNVVGSQTVRYTTTYTPTTAGNHYLSFSGLGPTKLFIDDVEVGEQRDPIKDAMGFFLGVQEEVRIQYQFSNRPYKIRLETHPSPVSNSELYLMDNQCSIHLGFLSQAEMEQDVLSEAIELARSADLAVLFVGNTTQWETEGQDLSSMTLPADGSQDKLVASVVAANPNTIVVNTTGVPVELPWIDDVPAFLQAWYAGQETGNAILDVLLGETCPSGKLPISWPKKYEHTGCYGNFGLDSYDSREVTYVEDVFVGYRWFDRLWESDREVRFPFGYGLSYTDFEFSEASISGELANAADTKVNVTVKVKNVGSIPGSETVQVYVKPPVGPFLERPVKELAAFAKTTLLQPGEVRLVEVEFGRDTAAFWDEERKRWSVSEGIHDILVSTSSHLKDVKAVLQVNVATVFQFEP